MASGQGRANLSIPNNDKISKSFASGSTIVSTGGKISNLQNLVDTATGQQKSSNSLQREAAYQTLLSATRQISESTQDSAIRNAAQSFEAQLTNAFNLSQSSGFEQSSHRAAQQNTGYVSNQDIRTMMDTSPYALQKATDIFGSPEAAQNALFHSAQARSYFAQQLQNDIREQTPVSANMQPKSIQTVDSMGRNHRSGFIDEQQGALQNAIDANRLDSRNAQQHAIGNESVYGTPDASGVEKSVQSHRLKTQERSSGMEQAMLQDRGATKVAKALYDEKQSGVSTVLKNAFMGGATYSSPQEYVSKLKENGKDSAIQQSLSEIGTRDKEVGLQDFELLAQSKKKTSDNK